VSCAFSSCAHCKGKAEAKIRDSETGLESQLIKVMEEEVPTFFNIMKELTPLAISLQSRVVKKPRLFPLHLVGNEGCVIEPGQPAIINSS
jgi:hypothetical protein